MSKIQRITLFVIAAIAAVGIAVGLVIALTPGHFIVADSGVTACKTIVSNMAKPNSSDKPATKEGYEKARTPFEKSSYADLRVAGTNVLDTVYKADSKKVQAGDLGNAIALMNTLQTQWSALQVACGTHGVTVPSLPLS